jgi:predicted HTH domain antitoxin
MPITPPPVEQSLTPDATSLHLAISQFVSEEASLGRAAEVAGLPVVKMMRVLAERRIPLHYGIEVGQRNKEWATPHGI